MPHFEIYVSDTSAGQKFYAGLLGWSFDAMDMGPEIEYFLATGHQVGMDQGTTVGLTMRPDTAHPAGSAVRGGTMTFEVTDCDAQYAWALANGGAEALPPEDYPGIGRCAYVEDGQGNIVGIITPAEGN